MNLSQSIKIVLAHSPQEFDDSGQLFQEYAHVIDFDAGFPNFAAELASLPKRYAPPNGALLIAYYQERAVGCVAVQRITLEVAELKRFYVQPAFRQFKIGAQLLEQAINQAKHLHFQVLRLEVIPTLIKARELYQSFGFVEIAPYQTVALAGTAYMEKNIVT